MPADYPPWENFSPWFVHQITNPFFVSSVLFTDEANFILCCFTNFHNKHQCAEEDPYGTIHARHYQQFRIDVLASTVGDHLEYPHVLPQLLNMLCLQEFPLKCSFMAALTYAFAIRS
jgi:hypothetical protein